MNLANHFLMLATLFLISCINLEAQNGVEEYINIEIYTGEEAGAGTNAFVNLFIDFDNDTWVVDATKRVSGNAFERGNVDKFDFLMPAFKKIKNLKVVVVDAGISSDWYLKKIIIRQENGKAFFFQCNCWLGKYREEGFDVTLKPMEIESGKLEATDIMLDVEVRTGDKRGAGTNANVYLTLNTEAGTGAPLKLNNRISGNAFERNDVDNLTIEHIYFRTLKSINIRHDNKGAGAGWYLDEIKIKIGNGATKIFKCNCWLEGGSNGRTLRPKS